jgi:hypothetical protein
MSILILVSGSHLVAEQHPTTKSLGTRRRVMLKTFRYALQVVRACVCNRELSGRRAEAILDLDRLMCPRVKFRLLGSHGTP